MDMRRHYTAPVSQISRVDCEMLIKLAIQEDAPEGDKTADSIFGTDQLAKAAIVPREDGVLCGLSVVRFLLDVFFEETSQRVEVMTDLRDGDRFRTGQKIAEFAGPVRSILRLERPILNFLQYLSGISTVTDSAIKSAPEGVAILDTRKTLPGYRKLAKHAVFCGGGTNHRIHLSDMALIKDNHIAASGSIRSAVEKIRAKYPGLPVEVEIDSPDQLQEVLSCDVFVVLLDNMDAANIRRCVETIRTVPESRRPMIEISGRWRTDRLGELTGLGPLGVSMGFLTHTTRFLDLSMEII